MPNPSVESGSGSAPTGWTTNKWGTNTASFSWEPTGHTGSHSLKVTMTAHSSGDAKWMNNAVTVSPNTTYTYSDYYTADVPTELDVQFLAADGTSTVKWLKNLPAASSWTQATATFTTPANTARVVIFHIIYSPGSLQTDDYSLAGGTGTSPSPSTSPTPSTTPTPTPTTVPTDRGFASLAFDDGRLGQYDYALPALNARNLKGSFYVIGDALTWGDDYMNASQVRALANAGNEIGNHTWDHANLANLSSSQVAQEFSDTQNVLRGQVGVTPTACAYPYGSYNSTVTTVAAQFFATCRSTEGGFNYTYDTPMYRLRTFYVHTSTTASQIRAAADQARAEGSWVIFTYHGVGTVRSNDDISASSLTAHLDQIVASGVTVAPVSAAYHALTGD